MISVKARFISAPAGSDHKFQSDFLMDARVVPKGGVAEVTNRLFAGAKQVPLLDAYEADIQNFADFPISKISLAEDGQFATIVGMVTKIINKIDRNGGNMAFVEVSDVNATIEVVFFARTFEKTRQHLMVDHVLMIRGKVQDREGIKKMLANDVMPVEELREKQTERLELRLDYDAARNGLMEKLHNLLKSEPGEKPVHLVIPTVERESELRVNLSEKIKVRLTDNLIKNLHKTPGVNRVQFRLVEHESYD